MPCITLETGEPIDETTAVTVSSSAAESSHIAQGVPVRTSTAASAGDGHAGSAGDEHAVAAGPPGVRLAAEGERTKRRRRGKLVEVGLKVGGGDGVVTVKLTPKPVWMTIK